MHYHAASALKGTHDNDSLMTVFKIQYLYTLTTKEFPFSLMIKQHIYISFSTSYYALKQIQYGSRVIISITKNCILAFFFYKMVYVSPCFNSRIWTGWCNFKAMTKGTLPQQSFLWSICNPHIIMTWPKSRSGI